MTLQEFSNREIVTAYGKLEQITFEQLFRNRWKWFNMPNSGQTQDGTTEEAYLKIKELEKAGFEVK